MEINKEEFIETNRAKDFEMERIRAEQMSLETVHEVLTKTLAEKDEKTAELRLMKDKEIVGVLKRTP